MKYVLSTFKKTNFPLKTHYLCIIYSISFIKICRSYFRVFSSHSCNKLFIVNSSISVLVSIINHLINLLRCKSFSNWFCNFFEFISAKATSSVEIKNLIKFPQRGFSCGFRLTKDLKESSKIKFFGCGLRLNNIDNSFSFVLKT